MFAKRFQFRLCTLVVAVVLMGIVVGLALKLNTPHIDTIQRDATFRLKEIRAALSAYSEYFKDYPPDNLPNGNGSEILYLYLGTALPGQGQTYGPFAMFSSSLIKTMPSGKREILSPFGSRYSYKLLLDAKGKRRGYIVVDPGADGLLGGTLDAIQGFRPDNSDANKDGVPDDKDNIYATPELLQLP